MWQCQTSPPHAAGSLMEKPVNIIECRELLVILLSHQIEACTVHFILCNSLFVTVNYCLIRKEKSEVSHLQEVYNVGGFAQYLEELELHCSDAVLQHLLIPSSPQILPPGSCSCLFEHTQSVIPLSKCCAVTGQLQFNILMLHLIFCSRSQADGASRWESTTPSTSVRHGHPDSPNGNPRHLCLAVYFHLAFCLKMLLSIHASIPATAVNPGLISHLIAQQSGA